MELLRTPRLLLRHWEEPDLPAFFDLYSREDVMRWLGPHPRRSLTTLDEARERLARWRAREPEAPLGLWAVVPLAPGTPSQPPAGTVLLMPLADADGPTGLIEVGWHLHPQHQGQGYATEAADALLTAAAGVGIGQVLALTDLDNVRSQAVAARLGMSDEGTTDRWFGLTARQFRKILTAGGGSAGRYGQIASRLHLSTSVAPAVAVPVTLTVFISMAVLRAIAVAVAVALSATGPVRRVGRHDGGRDNACRFPLGHGTSRRLLPGVRAWARAVAASRRGGDVVV